MIGGVTTQDIHDFLTAWFAGSPAADFDRNGSVGPADILTFLAAWMAGCH